MPTDPIPPQTPSRYTHEMAGNHHRGDRFTSRCRSAGPQLAPRSPCVNSAQLDQAHGIDCRESSAGRYAKAAIAVQGNESHQKPGLEHRKLINKQMRLENHEKLRWSTLHRIIGYARSETLHSGKIRVFRMLHKDALQAT